MSLIDQNRGKTIELMNAENKRNQEFGGNRLIEKFKADQYKEALVSVTGSLKAYAETFHFHVHSPKVAFSACQDTVCVSGRQAIDKAIAIITRSPND